MCRSTPQHGYLLRNSSEILAAALKIAILTFPLVLKQHHLPASSRNFYDESCLRFCIYFYKFLKLNKSSTLSPVWSIFSLRSPFSHHILFKKHFQLIRSWLCFIFLPSNESKTLQVKILIYVLQLESYGACSASMRSASMHYIDGLQFLPVEAGNIYLDALIPNFEAQWAAPT